MKVVQFDSGYHTRWPYISDTRCVLELLLKLFDSCDKNLNARHTEDYTIVVNKLHQDANVVSIK